MNEDPVRPPTVEEMRAIMGAAEENHRILLAQCDLSRVQTALALLGEHLATTPGITSADLAMIAADILGNAVACLNDPNMGPLLVQGALRQTGFVHEQLLALRAASQSGGNRQFVGGGEFVLAGDAQVLRAGGKIEINGASDFSADAEHLQGG